MRKEKERTDEELPVCGVRGMGRRQVYDSGLATRIDGGVVGIEDRGGNIGRRRIDDRERTVITCGRHEPSIEL